MALSPEQKLIYETKLEEELALIHEDRESIRRLASESLRRLRDYIADKWGIATQEVGKLLEELLGPWLF